MSLTLRPATLDDHPRFAALHAELHTGDPPPTVARWRDEMAAQTVVATRGGDVVGVLYGQVFADAGYVRMLVTDPAARRGGVARALMADFASRCRAAGCATWCLNVRTDNAAALALYAALGMREAYRSASMRVSWRDALALPASSAARGRVADPPELAALEARFGLHAGQLAKAARHGAVPLRVDEAGVCVGLASFDPAFPGAFPFRAAGVGAAAALLAAMRPHAREGDARVRLVAHEPDGVIDALCAAGAEVLLRMAHLEGPLPG